MTVNESKYAQDGVNIEEGDIFSRRAGEICKASYENSPFYQIDDMSSGNFRGPRGGLRRNLPGGCYEAFAPDGTGTKMICLAVAGEFRGGGADLIEMTAMDIVRWGGLAIGIIDVLDVSTLGIKGDATNNAAIDLIEGLGEAAKIARMVIVQGETAELGVCVGSDDPNAVLKANWAGMAFGAYHRKKMILGNTLSVGQIFVALPDFFRGNGMSSARKAHVLRFGPEYYNTPEGRASMKEVATPSAIYDPLLTQLNGWWAPDFEPEIKMHLIVHITGGGIKSKLAEDMLFPLGLSADLTDLCAPPQIMKDVVKWREMEDAECYTTFNGGQGALVVIDSEDEERFINRAAEFGIEAKKAGTVTRENTPRVRIVSQFTGNEIIYQPEN